jgi:hypothetical protein
MAAAAAAVATTLEELPVRAVAVLGRLAQAMVQPAQRTLAVGAVAAMDSEVLVVRVLLL